MLELYESRGIEQLGSVKWQLTLCLVAVYIICYFSLWKGISTSGKVKVVKSTDVTVMFGYNTISMVWAQDGVLCEIKW